MIVAFYNATSYILDQCFLLLAAKDVKNYKSFTQLIQSCEAHRHAAFSSLLHLLYNNPVNSTLIWGLGSSLVIQVSCLGDALGPFGE